MAIDYTRINWKNEPNETTPLSAENLNKMDKAIDDLVTDVNSLEPNPEEVATEGLEKLAYGGTVYEVKGGHKIVNDNGTTLAQKDNMKFGGVYSHNSSTMTEVDIVREFNSVADIEALTGEEAKGFQYLDDDVYDAFTAGDIGFDNSDTSFVGTNVQDVLEEVDSVIDSMNTLKTGNLIQGSQYSTYVQENYQALAEEKNGIVNVKVVITLKGVSASSGWKELFTLPSNITKPNSIQTNSVVMSNDKYNQFRIGTDGSVSINGTVATSTGIAYTGNIVYIV